MKRTLIPVAVVLLFVVPSLAASESYAPTAREWAQDQCRNNFAANFVQKLWEGGADLHDFFRTTGDAQDIHVGHGLTALFYTIRAAPSLSDMTESEFVELVTRICEPVYEAVFEHGEKQTR